MVNDAKLEILRAAQQLAFQRKQDADQALQRAWDHLQDTTVSLNSAREAKQRALYDQNSSWRERRRVRVHNRPRIDRLHYQREAAFENAKRSRSGPQSYVAKRRRRLVKGILAARSQYESTNPAYQRAKDDFNSAKQAYDRAKAAYKSKQAKFGRAKSEFDQAVSAYRARLERVVSESEKRKNNRSVNEKAGAH